MASWRFWALNNLTTFYVNNLEQCISKIPKIEPQTQTIPQAPKLVSSDNVEVQELNIDEQLLNEVMFDIPDIANLTDGVLIPDPTMTDAVNVQETTRTADTDNVQDTTADTVNVREKTKNEEDSDDESDAEIVVRNSLE